MTRANAILRSLILAGCASLVGTGVYASDHLDTPTVIGDPAADIGDLYAWMSPDGERLNLAMSIVGKRFSDQIAYTFHIDSGKRVGNSKATTAVACRFDAAAQVHCEAAGDVVTGNADRPEGIESQRHQFRVFAGLRNDPFVNNVRGTRQAYEVAEQALKAGVSKDVAGCPALDSATARKILDRWRHTDGGPAKDFLAGWQTAALVVSIDVRAVNRGGPLLAVWAGTYGTGKGDASGSLRFDRMGRTLTGNALLRLFEGKEAGDERKEQYNRAAQKEWKGFAADIERSLGLYDGFDGVCGNQWKAVPKAKPTRYRALAELLADDRLWVDTRGRECKVFMAVERGLSIDLTGQSTDCGGRTPDSDAVDVYRALLINGTDTGADDGVSLDEKQHSTVDFPFLAAP